MSIESNPIEKVISTILTLIYEEKIADQIHFTDLYYGKDIDISKRAKLIISFVLELLNKYVFQIFDDKLSDLKTLKLNETNLKLLNSILVNFVLFYYFLINAWYAKKFADINKSEFTSNYIYISTQILSTLSTLTEDSYIFIKKERLKNFEQVSLFFTTENNFKLFDFYDLLFTIIEIIQKSNEERNNIRQKLNTLSKKYTSAISFLNNLDQTYIDTAFFNETSIVVLDDSNNEKIVNKIEVNVHNIISTIVTILIYQNENKSIIDNILIHSDFENRVSKYITVYIGQKGEYSPFDNILNIYNNSILGSLLAEIILEKNSIENVSREKELINRIESKDYKLLKLFTFGKIIPIVDDHLRYNVDTDRIEDDLDEGSTTMIVSNVVGNINAKTFYKNARKSKNELVKINIISQKIRSISGLYSQTVQNNPELKNFIEKWLNSIVKERKGSTRNYEEELKILQKIEKRKAPSKSYKSNYFNSDDNYKSEESIIDELSESSLNTQNDKMIMEEIIDRVYYNFTDFRPGMYGADIYITDEFKRSTYIYDTYFRQLFNVFRYSDIEFINYQPNSFLDYHNYSLNNQYDEFLHNVGLLLGPFPPVDNLNYCKKKDLLSIDFFKNSQNENIQILQDGKIINKSLSKKSNFKIAWSLLKYFFIDTIDVKFNCNDHLAENNIVIFKNYQDNQVIKLNPFLKNKSIYWIYSQEDIVLDESIENVQNFDNKKYKIRILEIIEDILTKLYDKVVSRLKKQFNKLIKKIYTFENINSDLIDSFCVEFIKYFNLESEILFSFDNLQGDWKYYLKKNSVKVDSKSNTSKSNSSKINYEKIKEPISINYYSINEINDSELHIPVKIDATNNIYFFKYLTKEERIGGIFKNEITQKHLKREKCAHELSWLDVLKAQNDIKIKGLEQYNNALSEFMTKYVIDIANTNYLCNVCGMVLQIAKYTSDAKFDNEQGKYVSNSITESIILEDIPEYQEYVPLIKYFESMIIRVSGDLLNTNLYLKSFGSTKYNKSIFLKNLIDLIVFNNELNTTNFNKDKEKIAVRCGVVPKYDYTILDNNYIADLSFLQPHLIKSKSPNINQIYRKKDNLILYFTFLYILELSNTQIVTMYFDKMCSIYSFEKVFLKLFGKFNIYNQNEKIQLIQYPVLCYVIYNMSYHFVRYNLWSKINISNAELNPKKADLVERVIFMNSLIMLINNIIHKNNYVKNKNDKVNALYKIVITKFFTQLNNVFRDQSILESLNEYQKKYSKKIVLNNVESRTKSRENVYLPNKNKPEIGNVSYSNPLENKSGFFFGASKGSSKIDPTRIKGKDLKYCIESILTTCPDGNYHEFIWNPDVIFDGFVCELCGQTTENQITNKSQLKVKKLTNMRFKKILLDLSGYKCPDGSYHKFIKNENDNFICKNCGSVLDNEKSNEEVKVLKVPYTNAQLNRLNKSINNENHNKSIENIERLENLENKRNKFKRICNEILIEKSQNIQNKKDESERLINLLERYISKDVNLSLKEGEYVYLSDKVFIITKNYNNILFPDPLVLKESDGKIKYVKNHPIFSYKKNEKEEKEEKVEKQKEKDVWQYTNKENIDVIYDAETLDLIAYKEKRQAPVFVSNTFNSLKIIPSIKEIFLKLVFDKNKIKISKKDSTLNNKKQFLKSLVRQYRKDVQNIIDLFNLTLVRINNKKLNYGTDKDIDLIQQLIQISLNENNEAKSNQFNQFSRTSRSGKNGKSIPLTRFETTEIYKHYLELLGKYISCFEDFNLFEYSSIFDEWHYLKNGFFNERLVDNITISDEILDSLNYVDYQTIISSDVYGEIYFNYFINELENLIETNQILTVKINLCKFIVDMIVFINKYKETHKSSNTLEGRKFWSIVGIEEIYSKYYEIGFKINSLREIISPFETELDINADEVEEAEEELTKEEKRELEYNREEAESVSMEYDYRITEDADTIFDEE